MPGGFALCASDGITLGAASSKFVVASIAEEGAALHFGAIESVECAVLEPFCVEKGKFCR